MSGSFNPHNNPVRWCLLPLFHIRGNQGLERLGRFPEAEPGLAVDSRVFQTPKPRLLTCIAILPKPTVMPAALASASKACRGVAWIEPGQIHSLSPLQFSLLTGTGSVRHGPGGVGRVCPPSVSCSRASWDACVLFSSGTGH